MIPRDAQRIIDDLGFRASWMEKTVQMNIEKLEAMAALGDATPAALRAAAANLAADTRKELHELQICAVERLLISGRAAPAEIVPFPAAAASSDKLPRPTMVPA